MVREKDSVGKKFHKQTEKSSAPSPESEKSGRFWEAKTPELTNRLPEEDVFVANRAKVYTVGDRKRTG